MHRYWVRERYHRPSKISSVHFTHFLGHLEKGVHRWWGVPSWNGARCMRLSDWHPVPEGDTMRARHEELSLEL